MSEPTAPAGHAGGTTRHRAVVAYDGSAFHGFAPNPGVVTVGGTLAQALSRVLGHDVELTCAGRTDAGVHAWGQVVSFDAAADLDCPRVQRALNKLCGPALVVRSLEPAPEGFDARFSARSRTYRYRILNRAIPDPFLHRTTWHVSHPLDLAAMNRAGQDLVGRHDFSSFCRRRTVDVDGRAVEASLVREVLAVEWRRGDDDLVEHWITATAFCHQMVRSITGTLVDVGRQRLGVDALPELLAARDRNAVGQVAPPHGLVLWSVAY